MLEWRENVQHTKISYAYASATHLAFCRHCRSHVSVRALASAGHCADQPVLWVRPEATHYLHQALHLLHHRACKYGANTEIAYASKYIECDVMTSIGVRQFLSQKSSPAISDDRRAASIRGDVTPIDCATLSTSFVLMVLRRRVKPSSARSLSSPATD